MRKEIDAVISRVCCLCVSVRVCVSASDSAVIRGFVYLNAFNTQLYAQNHRRSSWIMIMASKEETSFPCHIHMYLFWKIWHCTGLGDSIKEVQTTWKKKDSLTVSLKMFILWHICLKKQQQNTEDNQTEDMIPMEQDDSANYNNGLAQQLSQFSWMFAWRQRQMINCWWFASGISISLQQTSALGLGNSSIGFTVFNEHHVIIINVSPWSMHTQGSSPCTTADF